MAKKMTREETDRLTKKYGFIKINLPDTIENYRSGNGEGIFAVVTNDEDHDKYQNNCVEGQFIAISCSDSVYYPGEIKCFDEILCEFRGVNRPVACWDNLKGTKKAAANKEDVIRKLTERDDGS